MINADVVVENKLWKKKITNAQASILKKKIKKIFQLNLSKKKTYFIHNFFNR